MRGLGFVIVLAAGSILPLVASTAFAAGQCSTTSYRNSSASITARLRATGYSNAQSRFLMRNVDRMIFTLRAEDLNGNAIACGIDSARSHVLGCLEKQLFPLRLGSGASLDEGKPNSGSYWGRKRLTVRELLFIGAFHSCFGAAKEHLFRG
jgi:hypothetical protein